MNEAIAALISICGLIAIGYRMGHSFGFNAGRGQVFDEVRKGVHPVCYKRQATLVARYSPFFPTTISAGIQDQLAKHPAPPPGSTVRESMGKPPTDPLWLQNMQARTGKRPAAEFVHPFLNGASHG